MPGSGQSGSGGLVHIAHFHVHTEGGRRRTRQCALVVGRRAGRTAAAAAENLRAMTEELCNRSRGPRAGTSRKAVQLSVVPGCQGSGSAMTSMVSVAL